MPKMSRVRAGRFAMVLWEDELLVEVMGGRNRSDGRGEGWKGKRQGLLEEAHES